eukprot:jgi/Bigna1/37110/e_gw1.18.40.1
MPSGFLHRKFSPEVFASAKVESLPSEYNPCSQGLCTPVLNQRVPQFCDSGWAHAAVSSMGDRVARKRKQDNDDHGPKITLSTQHILNCPLVYHDDASSSAGSCNGGGDPISAYRLVKERFSTIVEDDPMSGHGLSYFTDVPYIACSADSTQGFCSVPHVQQLLTCTPLNVARTCSTFTEEGGNCTAITFYPNVKLADYGQIKGREEIKAEIFNNGPISCGLDANPLRNYSTGIVSDRGQSINHVVSLVGWGTDEDTNTEYFIARNSWGTSWGESGFFRLEYKALMLDTAPCAFGIVKSYTVADNEIHFSEDGVQMDEDPKRDADVTLSITSILLILLGGVIFLSIGGLYICSRCLKNRTPATEDGYSAVPELS